jgi:AraC-like DNA-binding protein
LTLDAIRFAWAAMLGTFRNWAEIVGRTLAVEGVDLRAELAGRGVDIEDCVPAEGRLDNATARAIWHVVEDRSSDPVFGLSMVRNVDYIDFEDLGVALVAGGTAEAVLNRLVRYHGLITDRLTLSLETGQRLLELQIDHHATHWRSGEFSAALFAGMLRDRFDRTVGPTEVGLGFDNPAGLDIYRRFFRSPILTGAAVTRLTFDRQVMARHGIREPIGVAERFEQLLQDRVEQLSRQRSAQDDVRSAIRAIIGADQPTLDRVAAALHVSERTLQRRLHDEGTSFAAVLDEERRELAATWLEQGSLSRTEIAYFLGFSQPSSFSRATRRWFPGGETVGHPVGGGGG